MRDIRFGFRFLRRNPGFGLSAAAILALGIGLSTTLYAVVKGALIEPWPYRGYDRIVTVSGNYPEQGRSGFSLWSVPEIDDLEKQPGLFDYVIAGDARNVNLSVEGRPERVRAAVITPNAFEMLGVAPLLGRTLQQQDAVVGAPAVVLVSHAFWRAALGADPGVVGRDTLRIGDVSYAIVGVMPQQFVFWDRDLWMPLSLNHADSRADRRYYVQAQLRPGLTPPVAETRLRGVAGLWRSAHPEVAEYAGLSFTIRGLVEDVLRDLRPTLYVLLAAVALVLIVAAANLANAMLAKGLAREGELALRRALGATAGQMARQLLAESVAISAAGALLGAAFASFLLPRVLALIPYGYVPAEAHVAIDANVLACTMVTAIVCGLLLGIVPAVRAARVSPGTLLKRADARTGSGRTHLWRSGFSSLQLALAVTVLGVAVAAFANVRASVLQAPGFDTRGVWSARLALPANTPDAVRVSTYDRLLTSIRETNGVHNVSLASAFPVVPLASTLVSLDAAMDARSMATLDVDVVSVSPEFFRLLSVPLVDGRVFDAGDRAGSRPVAIVTANLAERFWPRGGAVLGRLVVGEGGSAQPVTLVGVVGNIQSATSDARMRPTLFVPIAQRPPTAVMLGVTSGDLGTLPSAIARAVASVDPLIPVFGQEMLEQTRVAALGPQLLAAALLGLFGLSVLALSAVGIYAVISQSVQERLRELGIRLALGARPGRVFAGELLRTGRLLAVGIGAGATAGFVGVRAMSATFPAFRASPFEAVGASAGIVILLALAATIAPAYRAGRTDLISSLRGR